MKKQTVRKLVLGKETLRQLDGAPLGKAAGGLVTIPCPSQTCTAGEHMTSNSCNASCKEC